MISTNLTQQHLWSVLDMGMGLSVCSFIGYRDSQEPRIEPFVNGGVHEL